MRIIFNPFTNKFDFVDKREEPETARHNDLINLEWSKAGHIIDEGVDFNLYPVINFSIQEVNTLPTEVNEGQLIRLTTNKRLYLGV